MKRQSSMNKKPDKVVIVTNIPSPYRTFLYDTLQDAFEAIGIGFCVHYLSVTEHDRHWHFDGAKVRHSHRFEPGFHLNSSMYRHINLGAPFRLARLKNTLVIVGGYDNFATLILTLLPRHASVVRMLWTESNHYSEARKGGIASAIKRHAIGSYHGYLVPGAWARDFVITHCPASAARPFVSMPNTIDEESFLAAVSPVDSTQERIAAGISKDDVMVFVSARLELFKNVLFTVKSLPDEFWQRCVLCVAGTGSEKKMLAQYARERGIESRLILLGQIPAERMPACYLMADLFLLPSLQDPSPLSCVEAMTCGLPLALSSHIGNHPEVLETGVNGFLFDPNSRAEISAVGSKIAALSRDELKRMGERSRVIALERFATRHLVSATVERILAIYAAKTA